MKSTVSHRNINRGKRLLTGTMVPQPLDKALKVFPEVSKCFKISKVGRIFFRVQYQDVINYDEKYCFL